MKKQIAGTLPLNRVLVRDKFWSGFERLVRETVIPYQWEALNDRVPEADPSYAIRNFRRAAGLEEGDFGGMVFQDSDVAKWLEAVGFSLANHPDPDLEKLADEAIDLVVQAQHEDGYLNTFYTIREPGRRWTNLTDCHELYVGGHMMEAAVAYYYGTGKRKLLDAMCRFADHIDEVFGSEPGKLPGYDGHQEIELALVKLYEATGNEKYLRLSKFFIEQRGQEPNFFMQEFTRPDYRRHWQPWDTWNKPNLPYHQAHKPVREQEVAIGHSVRAVYMYTAMADLARETSDDSLLAACQRLWRNIADKQMYITGGIGSTHHGEAFSFNYDLPNDTVYAETCASIGLIFFAQRMLQLEAQGEYADVMERALYNLVIGSMAADGKHYFYVNPLEVWPDACRRNPGKHHVKPVRQRWFGCACCPPNLARLLSSLGQYIYTVGDNTIYTHLYIGNESNVKLGDGRSVRLNLQSELPHNGAVSMNVGLEAPGRFTVALREPSWCAGRMTVRVNGTLVEVSADNGSTSSDPAINTRGLVAGRADGYIRIDREWADGDTIELDMPMEAQWVVARPDIRADAGKAAIVRGPLVYCVEEADNGKVLAGLTVSLGAKLDTRYDADVLGGTFVIETDAMRDESTDFGDAPYRTATGPVHRQSVRLRAIPYFLWGNRGEGEMSVWIRTRD